MYQLSIPVISSVAIFLVALLPALYEKIQYYFLDGPDMLLSYVNTTLVPRFGNNGGILVLTATKAIVFLLKAHGHLMMYVGKQLFQLALVLPQIVASAKNSFMNGFFKLAGILILINLAIFILNRIFRIIFKQIVKYCE